MEIEDFYFAAFVAWELHPGNGKSGRSVLDRHRLEVLADLVDLALEVRKARWPQLQQQQ